MKVKIVEPGFLSYTGVMLGVKFENGVSVDGLNKSQMDAIGGIMRVESIDGGQVGISVDLIAAKNDRAPIVKSERVKEPEPVKVAPKVYTRDDLDKVVTEKGIGGLREIAEVYGLKGKSINDLIAGILSKQPVSNPVKTDTVEE